VVSESELESLVLADIEQIIKEIGFFTVDVKVGFGKKKIDITVVIFRPEGIGINDCMAVSKVIYPRLQIMEGFENLELKVTSPGIERVIRTKREYEIFINKGMKILLKDSINWIGGILEEACEHRIKLKTKDGKKSIDYANIKKAKLDYREEV